MTEVNEERTARIYDEHITRLENEIAKLNRRADKIECPHIGYRIVETNMVPDPYELKALQKEYEHSIFPIPAELIHALPLVRQHTIEIVGDGPKIDGWKFVGTLDHYTIPGKVIVNAVPGEDVPEQYFEIEATCDHCQKIRRRIETFVLEGTDENEGEWQAVGRNCLKDFFGHDPMYVVRFLNRIWNFIEGLEDEEKWGLGGGGRYTTYYNSKKVLAATAAIIRTWGWVARSKAGPEQVPTAGHVIHVFSRPVNAKDAEAKRLFLEQIQWDEEKDAQEAEDAIAWLKTKEGDNEYMHNLKLLEDEDNIPSKMMGYWCSLMAAYQREQERLEYQKRQQKLNAHYGEVGERIEVRVRCQNVRAHDGFYGTVNIHRMWTEEGHTLIWFANTDRKMEKGCEYTIRATIKEHDEYKDWKQTKLARLHVVQEHAETEEAA